MRSPSLERFVFSLSLATLAFLVGFLIRTQDAFPSSILDRALRQGTAFFAPPHYMQPRVYERTGARSVEPESIQPGLTLVATWWEDFGWTQGLKLIDRKGGTVHAWRVDGAEIFPDLEAGEVQRNPTATSIHGAYLFPDGDVIVNLEYSGTARLDACGRILWTIPRGGHHSIARGDGGTFWTPAGTGGPQSESDAGPPDYPGLDVTYRDLILHVSEEGVVLEEIDVLGLLYENGLERHVPKSDMTDRVDITHINDVEPLSSSMADEYPLFEAGDLVASLRPLDLVFVFDPESSRVKWHASHPFIRQHDPDFIGNGWIGVFDNNADGTARGTMLGGSRIVLLQPHTDSLAVTFPTSRSEPFYTDVQGKWQRLANGNVLLTEAQAGRVVEVAPDGRTVWDWVAPPKDGERVPEVTEGTRYDLTREDVASWRCSASGLRNEIGTSP